MLAGKDAASYLALIEEIEEKEASWQTYIAEIFLKADDALKRNDTGAFLALGDLFAAGTGREVLPRSVELMQLRYIFAAVSAERESAFPLFTEGVADCKSLLDKYTQACALLRRIEFHFGDDAEAAIEELFAMRISPYLISGALYALTSRIGHREEILLQLASAALEKGDLQYAYGLLLSIQEPCEETLTLREELSFLLQQGVRT